jgi:hypothetical protein
LQGLFHPKPANKFAQFGDGVASYDPKELTLGPHLKLRLWQRNAHCLLKTAALRLRVLEGADHGRGCLSVMLNEWITQRKFEAKPNTRMTVYTDTPMPPFGVVDLLVGEALSIPDRFYFWLMSHGDGLRHIGPKLWCAAVLRECLPSAKDDLNFEAIGQRL